MAVPSSKLVQGIVAFGVAGAPLLLGTALPAGAAGTVASWQMNEGSGATVMRDSSGHGHNGRIGSRIQTGVGTPGGRGYRFPQVSGSTQSRLVTVADSSALDPGSSSFAVTVRLRTGAGAENIVQKGQATTPGGYWKLDMTRGRAHCEFRDSSRRIKATGSRRAINDGRWHTLRCARTSAGVSLSVDGSTTINRGSSGSVSNPAPLTIGGKLFCSAPGVGCDHFIGVMEFVRVER